MTNSQLIGECTVEAVCFISKSPAWRESDRQLVLYARVTDLDHGYRVWFDGNSYMVTASTMEGSPVWRVWICTLEEWAARS